MFELINVLPIIKNHFSTLNKDAKLSFIVLIFFILPTLVSSILVFSGILIKDYFLPSMITAFLIFFIILFNILFQLTKTDWCKNDIEFRLVKHLFYNTFFVLLLDLLVVFLALMMLLLSPAMFIQLRVVFSVILYFFGAQMFLTFLMILKRIFAVWIEKETKR